MYLITNLRDFHSYTLGLKNMRIFGSIDAAKKYFKKSSMRTARIWELSESGRPKLVAVNQYNTSGDWETK